MDKMFTPFIHLTNMEIVPVFCGQFEGIEQLTHKLSFRGKRSRYESPALVINISRLVLYLYRTIQAREPGKLGH